MKLLEDIIKSHRRCRESYSANRGYSCICGEPVASNSHHSQARHMAQKILEAGFSPPVPEKTAPHLSKIRPVVRVKMTSMASNTSSIGALKHKGISIREKPLLPRFKV